VKSPSVLVSLLVAYFCFDFFYSNGSIIFYVENVHYKGFFHLFVMENNREKDIT